MEKITLEPGRKYKGSFWLNEYGEIQVRPEQKGTRPGNFKLVNEYNEGKIYESAKTFKVSMVLPKTLSPTQLASQWSHFLLILLTYFKPRVK